MLNLIIIFRISKDFVIFWVLKNKTGIEKLFLSKYLKISRLSLVFDSGIIVFVECDPKTEYRT